MSKFLRFIGILFLSISALFNIAGGVGTTCIALNPTGYGDSFAPIADMQWLYILFVIGTTAFGVLLVRAVILVIKGRENAYRASLISLAGAVVIGVIHVITSRALRGGSMPVDGVLYCTVLTLVIFLLFKIPKIWDKVDFTKAKRTDTDIAGGATAIISSALCLTVHYIVAPTHVINGVNYGDAFHITAAVLGWGLLAVGTFLIVRGIMAGVFTRKAARAEA